MLKLIRQSKLTKIIAVYLAFSALVNFINPLSLYALTSGPSQPEVQSFSPIGTTEMVDLFSGAFTYNIPLIDVGGYPINIVYNSGIGMDQEASWVGLGWNINPGVVNRNMRGLPDDFNGKNIKKRFNIKENSTYYAFFGFGKEIAGKGKNKNKSVGLSLGMGVKYNNYNGINFTQSATPSVTFGSGGKTSSTASLGFQNGTDGIVVQPNMSFKASVIDKIKKISLGFGLGVGIGTSYSSRKGLEALTLNIYAFQKQKQQNINTARIDFGLQTYIPTVSMPMETSAVGLSFKYGITNNLVTKTYDIQGGYSSQSLKTNYYNSPSYGYMYLQNCQNNKDATLDFNREKDFSYTKNTPNLPIPNLTYDIYSISGQGVGGVFRPYRNEVVSVYDREVIGTSNSFSAGAELSLGSLYAAGVDITTTEVYSKSGKWDNNNNINYKFSDDKEHEPYYFKLVGEKTVDEEIELLDDFGGFNPVRVDLVGPVETTVSASSSLKKRNDKKTKEEVSITPIVSERTKRVKRNQVMSALTYENAKNFAVDKSQIGLKDFKSNSDIAEITVLKDDGARYVYGKAIYNKEQVEASFNVAGNSYDLSKNEVEYNPGVDDSENNKKGENNYFDAIEIGPYAHSYMLTSVLSADYVDNDNIEGPSDGDLGSYTKFYYDSEIEDYGWRTPYEENKASYNEVCKSKKKDNVGSYIRGKKDISYLSKIETKNYIAIFELEDRHDGIGSKENGGQDVSKRMKLLKKISLYSKNDYNNSSNPTPIKTVNFVYDYSLCKGVPNNDGLALSGEHYSGEINEGGKLTLKKIYFTYGNSYKGRLSPYEFSYSDDYNYDYNKGSYDCWGNYKTAKTNDDIYNSDFPYVNQDKDPITHQYHTDNYAKAWNLNKINLPSGGEINVEYESNDYAYVQNKPAMQFFKIINCSSSPLQDSNHELPKLDWEMIQNGVFSNSYLYFVLDKDENNIDRYFESFENINGTTKGKYNLYFKFFVDITDKKDGEFVTGFADIDDYGVITRDGQKYGYIKLKTVPINDNNSSLPINPITKAAIQYGKINLTDKIFGNPEIGEDSDFKYIMKKLVEFLALNAVGNISELLQGVNKKIIDKGYCSNAKLSESWIRLDCPDKFKKGGGARVKKITISDNWTEGAGNYGQEFEYTINEGGRKISSGVAAYEPFIGGEENPWRQPIYVGEKDRKEQLILAPDDDYYMVSPMGESLFPAPKIGYRKVTVRNMQRSGVKINATGRVEHEFYTTFDFPTNVWETKLEPVPVKTKPILKIIKSDIEDYMTTSQGYVVELNDMDGKPKSITEYPEFGDDLNENDNINYVSKIKYNYYTQEDNNSKLNNKIKVIYPNGEISEKTVGVEFDIVSDMREESSDIVTSGNQLNLTTVLYGTYLIPIPYVCTSNHSEKTRFRSSVISKVIRRYGILKEIIVEDQSSTVSTKNLAFDSETGEVLLTETVNEFDDPIYNFTYPAHWAYDRMGQAYKNIGAKVYNLLFDNGIATVTDYIDGKFPFTIGDEVGIIGTNKKGWVISIMSGSRVKLVDNKGDLLDGNNSLIVLRSGRKNLSTIPIGNLITKDNIINNDLKYINNYPKKVLDATAITYTEDAIAYCQCQTKLSDILNPFYFGTKGNWRAEASYKYLTNRSQSSSYGNSNIREDGIYTSYSPFWEFIDGVLKINSNNWTNTNKVTKYNVYGVEIENVDPLNRYSSAVYGYNQSLPIAVGVNSEYRELGYDGFEDYNIGNCNDDHLRFEYINGVERTNNESHTGKYSLKIGPNKRIILSKYILECAD